MGRVECYFLKFSSFVLLYSKFISLIIQPFLRFSINMMHATCILISVVATSADIAMCKFN